MLDPMYDVIEGADDDIEVARDPLSCCYMYPSYEYQPKQHATPAIQGSDDSLDRLRVESVESMTHAYLVRMHRLPAPLPAGMYTEHLGVLAEAMSASKVVPCNGNLTRATAVARLMDAAQACDWLLIVLCGHGRDGDGALWLSDGSVLSHADVTAALVRARFTGTVLCVTNVRHAGPNPLPLTEEQLPGFDDFLPFDWVTLHSCDSQKPAHALHVVRLLASLLRERPALSELQARADVLWVDTRHASDKPRFPSQWRDPPQIRIKRAITGRLLG